LWFGGSSPVIAPLGQAQRSRHQMRRLYLDRHPPQTSLAAILIALTALSVVFASWTWAGEARIFVMPIAGAFFGGVVVRYGFYLGLVIAVAMVIVNAMLMEKDPSGLGPTEVVVPIHLIVFAIPVFIAAWIGSKLQELVTPTQSY
jgi:hypothetical protein